MKTVDWKWAAGYVGLHEDVELEIGDWPRDLLCFPDGYYRREGSLHRIGYCAHLTEREISQTLWHELTHALQCERDFNGDGETYHDAVEVCATEEEAGDGDSPWETEAAINERLDKRYRIVVSS